MVRLEAPSHHQLWETWYRRVEEMWYVDGNCVATFYGCAVKTGHGVLLLYLCSPQCVPCDFSSFLVVDLRVCLGLPCMQFPAQGSYPMC